MTAIPARHVGKAPAALASPLVPPLGLEHHHTLLPHLEEDRLQPKHALDIQKHPMAGHWAKKAGIYSSTRLHLFPVLQVQAGLSDMAKSVVKANKQNDTSHVSFS